MPDLVITIITGIITSILLIYWGYLIYPTRKWKLSWLHIPLIIIYSLGFTYSLYNFSSILHIGTMLVANIILHQVIFQKSFSSTCAGVFYISIIKLVMIIVDTLLYKIIHINLSIESYWISSLTINLLTLIVIFSTRKIIKKIVKMYDIYNNRSMRSVVTVNFIIISIYISEISIATTNHPGFLIYPIAALMYLFIRVYQFVKQKVKLETYLTNYDEIAKFARFNENIISNYRFNLYETKNQLTKLRDRIKVKGNQKELNYINSLIEEKSHIKYSWLSELNYFKIPGIKGFISYKIQEMKQHKLEVELFVSDSLAEANLFLTEQELKDLYIMIGVYCDNAINASKNSLSKTITIQAYYLEKTIIIIIANTYSKNKKLRVAEKLSYNIHNHSYSTGFYITSSIIENNTRLNKETQIIDDFFIQKILIDTTPYTKYPRKKTSHKYKRKNK